VLDYMGKPHIGVYEEFMDRYRRMNDKYSKDQYIVPYLMSSHPGCTLADAVALAEYLNKKGRQPEQVQDFYPTPGTISTCMFYTELDPYTMEKVYVPKTPKEKAMQRALLQYFRPQNREIVLEALKAAGRRDLIGSSPKCLVEDISPRKNSSVKGGEKSWNNTGKNTRHTGQQKALRSQYSSRSSSKSSKSTLNSKRGRKGGK